MVDGEGHHRHPVWAMVVAFCVGVGIVVQSRINGQLAVEVQDGLLAAVLSFTTGFVILLLVVASRRTTRHALMVELQAELRSRNLRWWHLLGGLGGATLVAGQGLAVPVLGLALFTVLVVAGNTGSAIGVDRAGIGPGIPRPVTGRRIAAALITTGAVALAVSGRVVLGDVAAWAIVLAVVAGAAIAVQPALNGQIAHRTGDALAATTVNFAVGTAALILALAAEHALGHGWTAPPMPWEQPVLWLGGPVGILFIVGATVVVKPLGVLLYGLLSIAGQLSMSLLLDLVLPTPGTVVTWQLITGVVLTGLAVAWAAQSPRAARTTRA